MTWRITNVTPETLDDLIDMNEELMTMANLAHLGYTREHYTKWARQLIDDPTCLGMIAYNDTGVVGTMTGFVTTMRVSPKLLGSEETLYVRVGTPFRAAIAADMLRRFVKFCKDHGTVDVYVGNTAHIEPYASDVFYRRHGFKWTGNVYSLRNLGDAT